MSVSYAKDTNVSARRSRDEIERLLVRYGASDFALGETSGQGVAAFMMRGRHIKIAVPLPDPNAREFTLTPSGRSRRDTAAIQAAYEQATRSRWRSLVLILKAKLEAVAAGVVTFEQEFGMHMVLPGGQTVGEVAIPEIQHAYDIGLRAPSLLGGAVGRPELEQR